MTFSQKDISQINAHGLSTQQVASQIDRIEKGMIHSNLHEPATVGHGILKFEDHQVSHYTALFESKRDTLSMVKFVPASGAATRMFKFLFTFLNEYDLEAESIQAYIKRTKNNNVEVFFNGLEKLPCFGAVIQKANEVVPNYHELSHDRQCLEFAKTMLDKDRLNYSFYPKGLLPFHDYKTHISTAFEEHLYEAACYASTQKKAKVHFTVSKDHQPLFTKELGRVLNSVERQTDCKFEVTFSYQKPATDTVALNINNNLCRHPDGSILFRPSGHGALLENLNDLQCDLVFIKNIDNLVVQQQLEDVCKYKKLLAGILLEIQDRIFSFLNQLESESFTGHDIEEITHYATQHLNLVFTETFNKASIEFKKTYLMEQLNRPIRVCGMVKNEGEPGGGPFWVTDENGVLSLQIVEFAQIDITKPDQKEIVDKATHFNPTDLVCSTKNYRGEPFDLTKYVDPKAAFITSKTHQGAPIQALELPGLWNGSMAHWNSVFVEVPLMTFNPVKTINDLLKPAHQAVS